MSARLPVDRPWSEYPIGTKAHAYNGGHWIKVERGWKWFCGDTFPTPGGDACGRCIELPPEEEPIWRAAISPGPVEHNGTGFWAVHQGEVLP